MNLLGISGSLRKASLNTRLLAAASSAVEAAGSTVHHFDIGQVPLYDQDFDGDEKPAAVAALKRAIEQADGLLIVSPEYNYSVPGVLKNALDWASRPGYESVLAGKPTAILSASMAVTGGARMQAHLRNVLSATLSPVYQAPEFLLGAAQNAFEDDGLSDQKTRQRLEKFISGFIAWVRTFDTP